VNDVEWIQRFVDQHASPATRGMYASDLRGLVDFLERRGQGGLLEMTEQQAVAWRAELEARKLKATTVARKLAVGRVMFRYLLEIEPLLPGLARRNPFQRVRPPRFDRGMGMTPCPAPEEVKKLLGTIGTRTPRRRRDLLLALFLFNQGLWISEGVRLERSSVRTYGDRTYLALVGKGGAEVRSVLAPDVLALLERHLRSLPAGQRYLFAPMPGSGGKRAVGDLPMSTRTVRERLKAYVVRADLDPAQIRPHSGRVFFITQSYLATRDLERVARAVGHRALATTRRYLRLGTALEDHPANLIALLSRKRVRSHNSG
jgi:integrase/recombinase XerD